MNNNARIAGRFHLIEKTEDHTVVGLLGNIYAEDLSPENITYIKGFYHSSHFPTHKIIYDFPVKVNRKMFNNFIVFCK